MVGCYFSRQWLRGQGAGSGWVLLPAAAASLVMFAPSVTTSLNRRLTQSPYNRVPRAVAMTAPVPGLEEANHKVLHPLLAFM